MIQPLPYHIPATPYEMLARKLATSDAAYKVLCIEAIELREANAQLQARVNVLQARLDLALAPVHPLLHTPFTGPATQQECALCVPLSARNSQQPSTPSA